MINNDKFRKAQFKKQIVLLKKTIKYFSNKPCKKTQDFVSYSRNLSITFPFCPSLDQTVNLPIYA